MREPVGDLVARTDARELTGKSQERTCRVAVAVRTVERRDEVECRRGVSGVGVDRPRLPRRERGASDAEDGKDAVRLAFRPNVGHQGARAFDVHAAGEKLFGVLARHGAIEEATMMDTKAVGGADPHGEQELRCLQVLRRLVADAFEDLLKVVRAEQVGCHRLELLERREALLEASGARFGVDVRPVDPGIVAPSELEPAPRGTANLTLALGDPPDLSEQRRDHREHAVHVVAEERVERHRVEGLRLDRQVIVTALGDLEDPTGRHLGAALEHGFHGVLDAAEGDDEISEAVVAEGEDLLLSRSSPDRRVAAHASCLLGDPDGLGDREPRLVVEERRGIDIHASPRDDL